MTDTADTTGARLDHLERQTAHLIQLVEAIRRDLARSAAPVVNAAPDGTVAIRDPDIIAQQQRTEMRGYSQHYRPSIKPVLPPP